MGGLGELCAGGRSSFKGRSTAPKKSAVDGGCWWLVVREYWMVGRLID